MHIARQSLVPASCLACSPLYVATVRTNGLGKLAGRAWVESRGRLAVPVLRTLELQNILNLELQCDLLDSAVSTMLVLDSLPFSPTSCLYWSSVLAAKMFCVYDPSTKGVPETPFKAGELGRYAGKPQPLPLQISKDFVSKDCFAPSSTTAQNTGILQLLMSQSLYLPGELRAQQIFLSSGWQMSGPGDVLF